jgi:primosomal protein N' (replication factor Y)
LVRAEKKEMAMRMSAELGEVLAPPPAPLGATPEGRASASRMLQVRGPAEAPVPRLKNEYRYQFLVKAASRKALNELLQRVRAFAAERKWPATALVVDVDPLSLM